MIWLYFRRFYDLREDRDYKKKEVAKYLGIHPTVYSRYEKGVREVPIEILIKLAEYYGVSTDYLLGRTDVPTPYPPK